MNDVVDFEEQHRQVEQRVLKTLLSCLPEDWWAIELNVQHLRAGSMDSFPMEIANVDGPAKMVVPPEELFGLVLESFRMCLERGTPWRRVSYRAWFDQNTEDWLYKVRYDYGD